MGQDFLNIQYLIHITLVKNTRWIKSPMEVYLWVRIHPDWHFYYRINTFQNVENWIHIIIKRQEKNLTIIAFLLHYILTTIQVE